MASSTPMPEADRRPVTILFCDLVGYTSLSTQLDPELIHEILERYFGAVDAIVAQFGGTIDKHIGDAAMALFGAPIARGNDAERAVRAASEIQKAVPQLALGLPSPLAVHVGIASGEVIASSVGSEHHRGYTVTGEAANLAARLLGKAIAGETLVSGLVRDATLHIAAYDAVGSVELKGLPAAVDVWRLTGVHASISGDRALVGRRAELGQLKGLLAGAFAGSGGATALIRGEAGIGKSHLLEELRANAIAMGVSTHASAMLDFGTASGHGAVRTIVASLLELTYGSDVGQVESSIAAAIQAYAMSSDAAVFLRDLLEMPQPDEARSLYEAMDGAARFRGKEAVLNLIIERIASAAPVLIAVEDAHWADAEALDVLAALARATAVSRMVLSHDVARRQRPVRCELARFSCRQHFRHN